VSIGIWTIPVPACHARRTSDHVHDPRLAPPRIQEAVRIVAAHLGLVIDGIVRFDL
jgi:hypothetical protein